MNLEDVISNFPQLTVDAVGIAYRASNDVEPEFVWVNEPFAHMFGATQIDMIGRHAMSIYHDDYTADFHQTVTEPLASGRSSFSTDSLCIRDDRSTFWVRVSYFALFDATGPGRHSVVLVRDVDDLKDREQAAELALIENEQLLARVEATQSRLISALDTAPDPFAIFDSRDRLVICNTAYSASMTDGAGGLTEGMTGDQILRLGLVNNAFPEAIGREEEWLQEQGRLWRDPGNREFHIAIRGREYRAIRSGTSNGDRVVLYVDISDFLDQQRELKRYAERLERANYEISHQALHDELTGLGNRRFLKIKLDEMIARRRDRGGEIAALHIDLDRFKQINDTMGHAAGDYVLTSVARVLRERLREEDVIARTGGDEFVVLVRCKVGSKEPEVLARRLIDAVSQPVLFEGRPCRFAASIGIARTPLIDAYDLLTSSDVALYKAKMTGRARFAVFDHVDLQSLRESKRLTDDIARGLEAGEFVPVYQPQINPFTGEIAAFETLARWQHPERGLLPPSEFLTAAAEMQVDGQIDSAIFRAATSECRECRRLSGCLPRLSFNVSLQRIMGESFIADIERADYGGGIALELVETIFLEEESDAFLKRVEMLRRMNVRFEVDDFGSGRASIVALKRIAPDRLKIDRRLVEPITTSERARKLVRSIIDIAQALDIGVTAEGVETPMHETILKDFGCDRLQGYLYARPLPFAGMVAFLEGNQRDGRVPASRQS
ncbi:EAL domain-containing protein [Silicimonas algicola]|uniref:PAS domain S-box-containing protein/diguanylate cyclase (GGDEF)-like protein n=1 Tax=Silicimonas algicola TaxID=1826607 RepID=A0A316FZG9_9RHOB|nr:EAL domain-containing protein [Silicimonas algicola]AZQ69019.1 EAL domain-containing protein [Silicimonas algicola]PWK54094.1 PAS domain S-box-containing protein/diguanylate cyclase (GGDEF)-like protein [Silicimonas algicola]